MTRSKHKPLKMTQQVTTVRVVELAPDQVAQAIPAYVHSNLHDFDKDIPDRVLSIAESVEFSYDDDDYELTHVDITQSLTASVRLSFTTVEP